VNDETGGSVSRTHAPGVSAVAEEGTEECSRCDVRSEVHILSCGEGRECFEMSSREEDRL